MAKKLGKRLPKHEEVAMYWATVYNLNPEAEGLVRSALKDVSLDVGQQAHDAVKAKQQVLGAQGAGIRALWFMDAIVALRAGFVKADLARRREGRAREEATAKKRARKAGQSETL